MNATRGIIFGKTNIIIFYIGLIRFLHPTTYLYNNKWRHRSNNQKYYFYTYACFIDKVDKAPCLIFMFLVSLENVKKYSHVVARLPQRLKSTLFEIFSTLRVPFGHPPFEKISNNVDFSL